jgi:transposase
MDIGKAALDVSLAGQSPCRYANSAAGIAELVTALKRLPEPAQVICEPSGGYHRCALCGHGMRGAFSSTGAVA